MVLVLAQSLGFMHRVAHGPSARPDASAQVADQASGSTGHWLQALFAGHDEGTECPLFDSLTQLAAPAAVALTLPLQAACAQVTVSRSDFVARWSALFDARGPPAFR